MHRICGRPDIRQKPYPVHPYFLRFKTANLIAVDTVCFFQTKFALYQGSTQDVFCTTRCLYQVRFAHIGPVLRIRDPVLFYPLDLGLIFYPDPGGVIFLTSKTC
jgi:hypothetical protein